MSDTPLGPGYWKASDGKWYLLPKDGEEVPLGDPPGVGWWKASDGEWHSPEETPGVGWSKASDGVWYPPPPQAGWDRQKLQQPARSGGLVTWVAGLFATGSVIAFVVGLVNAGGHVQIGGEQGFILRGWQVMLGSALMFFGSLGLIRTRSAANGFNWRFALSVLMVGAAVVVWIGLGQTPQEFVGTSGGDSYCDFGIPVDQDLGTVDLGRLRELAPVEISDQIEVVADAIADEGQAAFENPSDELLSATEDVLAYDIENCPTDDPVVAYCDFANLLAFREGDLTAADLERWEELAPSEIANQVAVVVDAIEARQGVTEAARRAADDLSAYEDANCYGDG